jgi:hypothetical protein
MLKNKLTFLNLQRHSESGPDIKYRTKKHFLFKIMAQAVGWVDFDEKIILNMREPLESM